MLVLEGSTLRGMAVAMTCLYGCERLRHGEMRGGEKGKEREWADYLLCKKERYFYQKIRMKNLSTPDH